MPGQRKDDSAVVMSLDDRTGFEMISVKILFISTHAGIKKGVGRRQQWSKLIVTRGRRLGSDPTAAVWLTCRAVSAPILALLFSGVAGSHGVADHRPETRDPG